MERQEVRRKLEKSWEGYLRNGRLISADLIKERIEEELAEYTKRVCREFGQLQQLLVYFFEHKKINYINDTLYYVNCDYEGYNDCGYDSRKVPYPTEFFGDEYDLKDVVVGDVDGYAVVENEGVCKPMIFWAIDWNNTEIIRNFVGRKVDFNGCACAQYRKELPTNNRQLLRYVSTENPVSPLTYAFQKQQIHLPMIEALLLAGARTDIDLEQVCDVELQKEIINLFLKYGHPVDNFTADNPRKSNLFRAIDWKDVDMLSAMLKQGVSPNVSVRLESGEELSVLAYAIQQKVELPIIRTLLDAGAKMDFDLEKVCDPKTQKDVVRLLLAHGRVVDKFALKTLGNDFYKEGLDKKYLTQAMMNMDVKQLSFLLDNGVDVNMKDENGTPMFFYSPTDAVFDVFKEKNAKLNARDKDGKTAIFYAKTPQLLQAFVDAGIRVDKKCCTNYAPRNVAQKKVKENLGRGPRK